MTLAAAKSFGATSLTITDISPQNIALAKKMGATNAYCHPRTATPQEIADYLKKMLSPYGPEIVIDCVGFESTVQTAVRSCCMGGKVVVVGMGQDNMTLPMSTVGVHELDVLGCFRYANTVSYFGFAPSPESCPCPRHLVAAPLSQSPSLHPFTHNEIAGTVYLPVSISRTVCTPVQLSFQHESDLCHTGR